MKHLRCVRLAALGLWVVAATVGCHQLDFSPRVPEGAIDIYDDLFAVSVVDEHNAVAVGYHGAAYYTHDGGETWGKGNSGTTDLLYSVSMADSRYGFAVGQLGTILRTTDGGQTWQPQPNLKQEEGSHLFGVHAIDAQTAWAVGEWGTRILTRNGGSTWEDHSLTISLDHPMFVWLTLQDQERVREGKKVYEDVGLNHVYCLEPPATSCWIIGEFGYIFRSEDLGATWERGEIVGDVFMDPITLPYNVITLADADKQRLVEFAKKIEDQNHLNVLIDAFVSEQELREFGDPRDPYALFDVISARLDETKGVIEDAGILSDRLRMPNKPPWDYEDFLEDDPTFLDRYFQSRLAEQPTIKISVIQNPYLFTIFFRDAEHGLISGLGGVILRSENGGRSWRYETIDRKQALFAIAAVDGRAFAVGEKGLVRVSTDQGVSWRPPAPENFPTVFTFMRDLAFEHKQRVGFIVGQQGMVLRTADGGQSWEQVLPPEALGIGRML
jgi:photosystem II stability/assembly factor-like uncharacterized protein